MEIPSRSSEANARRFEASLESGPQLSRGDHRRLLVALVAGKWFRRVAGVLASRGVYQSQQPAQFLACSDGAAAIRPGDRGDQNPSSADFHSRPLAQWHDAPAQPPRAGRALRVREHVSGCESGDVSYDGGSPLQALRLDGASKAADG